MTWAEVLADPCLQDLPYKIELNRWGEIVMSPASNWHGSYQYRIGRFLENRLKSGHIIMECSIDTPQGVKVPDVVWCSEEFMAKYGYTTPYPAAPELCIEVMSPANSRRQMRAKMKLYFAKGARECWLVWQGGKVEMFNAAGRIEQSSFGVTLDLV
jgi:Uma2 family endonuclease